VSRKAFTLFASFSVPPSGSTASIHRAMAIVCLISFAHTHTRPFSPTALSKGNRPPRRGRRKWSGSRRLRTTPLVTARHLFCTVLNALSAHFQTTTNHKATFQFAKTFRFSCLSIETLKLRLHVFMSKRYTRIYQTSDLGMVNKLFTKR
jgi:hypothetical protein